MSRSKKNKSGRSVLFMAGGHTEASRVSLIRYMGVIVISGMDGNQERDPVASLCIDVYI